jgi:hypothetical protein
MGQSISNPTLGAEDGTAVCSKSGSSSSGFFKSFSPGTAPGAVGELAQTEGFMVSGKILNMSQFELEKWAKDNVRSAHSTPGFASPQDEIAFDDSALTPIDHFGAALHAPSVSECTAMWIYIFFCFCNILHACMIL